MTALTETLKRMSTIEWLRERHDNCIRIAGSKVVGSEKRGWLEDAAYFKDAIGRLDELERVTGVLDNVSANCQTAVNMSADYARKYGAAEATLTSLERELAQAKAQMRTPGAQEYCSDCGIRWCPEDGPWDLKLCLLNPDASPTFLEKHCSIARAIKRARSPAAKEAE